MGIVVTVAMLIGLLALLQSMSGVRMAWLSNVAICRIAAVVVLLGGVWNALWYGLRHLEQFWGLAALGSGLVMIATGVALLTDFQSKQIQTLLAFLLLGFFLLYLVSLVQLNLGMPILR